MKKFLKILIALSLALVCFQSVLSVSADEYTDAGYVTVVVDGQVLSFEGDQGVVISDGRTLLPLRKIFEALNASVYWDGDNRAIFAAKGDIALALQIDSSAMFKNVGTDSYQYTLDVPAMIINDRTMVPARAVSEALGASVSWDGSTNTVTIISQ